MRTLFLMAFLLALQCRGQANSTENFEKAWKDLNNESATERVSARKTIESYPIEEWVNRALMEYRSWAAIELIHAICNKLPKSRAKEVKPHLCELISTLKLEQMDAAQITATIASTQLIFQKLGAPTTNERHQMQDLWKHIRDKRQLNGKDNKEIEELLQYLGE